jgi:hypothetical protein
MGGIWLVFKARSAEEITSAYPELRVIDHRPGWMTDGEYQRIASHMSFDIDEGPTGWLASLIASRTET